MKLGSPKHRNPFKCLSSVWGGLGRKGAQDERKEEQSEYSVPMAFSQGAGPPFHSASHPVGRSQVRSVSGLPRHLFPRDRQLLKPRYQPRRQHSIRFSSRLSQRYNLSCKSRARAQHPNTDPGQIRQEIRSTLWVNPREIPIVCSGETAHRYDEKPLADSLTCRNGLKNGFLD